MFQNDYNIILLNRCRSNTSKLEWRNKFGDGTVNLKVCESGKEETFHYPVYHIEGWEENCSVHTGGDSAVNKKGGAHK